MRNWKIGLLLVILSVNFFMISLFFIVNNKVNAESTDVVLSNSYIEKFDISNLSYDMLLSRLNDINNNVVKNQITLCVNNNYYSFSLYDLGVSLNTDSLYKTIISSQNPTSTDHIYNFKYKVDSDKLRTFLDVLKTKVDVSPTIGNLEMGNDHVLRYVNDTVGYSLDVEKSYELLFNSFSGSTYSPKINLIGNKVYTDDPLRLINTKISSYTTIFDSSVKRKYNLYNAAKLTTGTVLMPGEVFSYWGKAGPYNRSGYVAYMGVLGNGVCQVATTIYNAELLAGLDTVTRYEHPDMVAYAPGGLDATVSSSPQFIADFKFKNSLKYPVYLSVYAEDNRLVAEIWSYENATEGLSYELESVRRSYGSYDAYRHVYNENKEEVRVDYLGRSHYYKEL